MKTNYIKQVKEFMVTMKQPVVDKPAIMPEDRNKLRIALIFEELKEYAEASGMLDVFNGMCVDFSTEFDENQREGTQYVPVQNLTEQFDALLDMQYVLSGAVIENGFGDIFDEGFEEVHRSNMSKVDTSFVDAEDSVEKYRKEGIATFHDYNVDTQRYIIKRLEDNKILKSHKYSPADLKPIIDGNK